MSKAQTNARYLVGIDLGTTNSVVCFADLAEGAENVPIKLFEIDQLVGPGEVAKRPMLPSFRYHPVADELPENQLVLPWEQASVAGDQVNYFVGEFARELGSKVEGRQIASAKSWLSHDKVDRTADILPWAGAADVAKVSPVIASASYLLHIAQAWNYEHPDQPLDSQQIVLTVPASFDEAARTLTLQAAELAGLKQVTLLEEPQAVCYDWFYRNQSAAETLLETVKLLFVVDVGGGTTDLSLIRVSHDQGKPQLSRIAVGDHWMLGGDNLDLAMARQAELRICQQAGKLSAASLSQLIQQSRYAKELLLGENPPSSAKVTLLGSGSKLIGSARSTEFTREEVSALALDGFFPLVEFGSQPGKRSGAIVEFGLPFAPDPAVSRYLSKFLSDHKLSCQQALGEDRQQNIPDAVLLNGGVFNSGAIADRVIHLLSSWRGAPVKQFANGSPERSVAQGAVAFALYRRNQHVVIGGGLARSYFLKVEDASGNSIGICLLPKGTEAGTIVQLPDRCFALQVNQPVQFNLIAYSGGEAFAPGEILDLEASEKYVALPPLIAALDHQDDRRSVEVNLTAALTEVGTLDIQCHASNGGQRWKVEFELRKNSKQTEADGVVTDGLPENFDKAVDQIELVFGASDKKADPSAVKKLRPSLEKLLGPRSQWNTAVARGLFDALWDRRKRRRRSVFHERVWFNLAGFCLRPGFGHPVDQWRLEKVWTLYNSGLQFDKENQSWAEWWTFWRRAAGGLNEAAQKRVFKDLAKYLNPESARNLRIKNEIKNKSYEDMVRLAASLENLPVATKQELGGWFSKRLEKASETQTTWWALGRVASREPFHGSSHTVVAPEEVKSWLTFVLEQDWRKNQNAAFAAVMMSRVTNDRARDLDNEVRQKVYSQLKSAKAPEIWQQLVLQYHALDIQESKRMFGEAMPVGLKLIVPGDSNREKTVS